MATLDEYNKIKQEQQGAYDAYRTDETNKRTELKEKFGYEDRVKSIDTGRRSVLDAETLLQNLPQNLKQRTAGRLMTAGQLARLQGKESQGLGSNLQNLSRSLGLSEQGLKDVESTIDRETQDLYKAYQLQADLLRENRTGAFNKYISDVGDERAQRQEALQERLKMIEINAARERAQAQAAAQQRLAQMQMDWDKQKYDRQEARDRENYELYQQQQAAQRKASLYNAKDDYIISNPTNMGFLDNIGLGLNIRGSKNKLKNWEKQEQDKNQYEMAVDYMIKNYDKGKDYNQKILQGANNPYAHLVDQYF